MQIRSLRQKMDLLKKEQIKTLFNHKIVNAKNLTMYTSK